MNSLPLICLIGVGILFFVNLFLFLFGKQLFKSDDAFNGWKTQVIIFSISTVLFFVYIVSIISTTGYVQTANVGGEIVTMTTSAPTEGFTYLYLLSAFEGIQLVFLIIAIVGDLKLLGRPRLSSDYD